MRKKVHEQLPLLPARIRHERAHEYAEVSDILDELPELLDLIDADVRRGARADTGRPGLSAEQVQRGLIVKQSEGFSYEQLAFHVLDSSTYRWFCRIGLADDPPAATTWQENIKRLDPQTIEAHHRAVLELAKEEGVEDGRTVRGDCTVVETNVHHPTDSSLLWDCVRVLTRLMAQAYDAGAPLAFSDHTRRARRRNLGISNARGAKARRRLYQDLLKVTSNTVGYAERAVPRIHRWWPADGDIERGFAVSAIGEALRRYVALARRVIEQTTRRVISGEAVPVADKLFSIFEPHTDLIMKGSRSPEFGHKVFLSGGRSGLVLDCIPLTGNPADATLVEQFLHRHVEVFGEIPAETAFDGGFVSKANVALLKDAGVVNAAFHKKRGVAVADMVRSTWAFRQLTRFRAGIEGSISWLKRCFGWTRCLWRGFDSFKTYVWSSVVTANLFVFARHRLA